MALDCHIEKILAIGPVFGKISGRHGPEDPRKRESRGYLIGTGGHGKAFGYFFGRSLRHLLEPAYEHDLIEPGGDGQDSLPKRKGAGGAGAFGARHRSGNEAEEVGDDRSPMRLVDEEVVCEIADIDRFDPFGVESFVYGIQHFPIRFHKKILGIPFFEEPELRQPAPYDRNSPGKSLASHGFPLPLEQSVDPPVIPKNDMAWPPDSPSGTI